MNPVEGKECRALPTSARSTEWAASAAPGPDPHAAASVARSTATATAEGRPLIAQHILQHIRQLSFLELRQHGCLMLCTRFLPGLTSGTEALPPPPPLVVPAGAPASPVFMPGSSACDARASSEGPIHNACHVTDHTSDPRNARHVTDHTSDLHNARHVTDHTSDPRHARHVIDHTSDPGLLSVEFNVILHLVSIDIGSNPAGVEIPFDTRVGVPVRTPASARWAWLTLL